MNCLNFTFCSGKEHCQLRFSPPQIELVDKPGKRERTWCAGKTFHHPGGLKGRKMRPKVIYYHETLMIPTDVLWGCHEPMSSGLCSGLCVLQTPSATCWYSSQPFRCHELCKSTGIPGYKIKPSLPGHCCNMTMTERSTSSWLWKLLQ